MVLEAITDTETYQARQHDYQRIDNEINVKPDKIFGARHFHALLLFMGLTCFSAMQLCLLISLVAIIDHHPNSPDSQGFDWDEKVEGYLLSSSIWGCMITQIPAGQLVQKYGAKSVLLWSTILSAVTTMLTPLGIYYGGWHLLCVLRLFLGMCQGFNLPSTLALLVKWSPVSERAQMFTSSCSGIGFGMMATLSGGGFLVATFGWPSIFYICGLAASFWSISWLFFGSNTPAGCEYISANELQYIQISLERHTGESSGENPGLKTPWKDIFTSRPFYALMIVSSTSNWGSVILLTYIPSYLKGVLKFDIKENGLLSALPLLVRLILSFFFCFLSGFLERNWLSLKYSRKIFNTIGHWTPAIALIALGHLQADDTTSTVILLVVAVGMSAAAFSGYQVNSIDIAPNFAGTLYGIVSVTNNVVSIMATLFVGMLLKDDSDVYDWRVIFYASAGAYFIGNLIFILFGSTKTQRWNAPGNLNGN